MKNRYLQRRSEAIVMLGGECVQCQSTENLEFDHIDRTTKSFSIGKILLGKVDRYLVELKKCQLLCKSCHRAKSISELSVDHGGGATGKKNCYCKLCRPLKQKYMQELYLNRMTTRAGSSVVETTDF